MSPYSRLSLSTLYIPTSSGTGVANEQPKPGRGKRSSAGHMSCPEESVYGPSTQARATFFTYNLKPVMYRTHALLGMSKRS
eukprot:365591-Chlamydomonas_euryale.AAC.6